MLSHIFKKRVFYIMRELYSEEKFLDRRAGQARGEAPPTAAE